MANPILVKDIVVARAGKNFVNGRQEFDLTQADIDGIIRNFASLKKQVPLLLTDDHIFGGARSAVPAAGWVEAMYRDGDDWHAKVKLIGEAAIAVSNDQFRGVSIGTVMGRDVHGNPVGECLDHLLITNSPFFPNLNIAASESAASVSTVRYITATQGETKMATDKTVVLDAAGKALVEAKENELVALKAANLQLQEENETLKEQLNGTTSAEDTKALKERNAKLEHETFAMKIRAVVSAGLHAGRLKPSTCDKYMGKDTMDFDGTIRWLRAQKFYDAGEPNADAMAFRILTHMAENGPVIYRTGQTYATGAPVTEILNKRMLTEDEKATITALKLDPNRIAEAPSKPGEPENYVQWKARKAAKESN